MALPNAYVDVNALSMQTVPNGAPEYVIPLWWYSGGSATDITSGTTFKLVKGSTSASNPGNSTVNLHTLNANWSPSQKYAFEATLWTANSSGQAFAELWDITSNSAVTASQINTISTTATVIRSGQFTLTPGHVYGVVLYGVNATYANYITDASLIVFAS